MLQSEKSNLGDLFMVWGLDEFPWWRVLDDEAVGFGYVPQPAFDGSDLFWAIFNGSFFF